MTWNGKQRVRAKICCSQKLVNNLHHREKRKQRFKVKVNSSHCAGKYVKSIERINSEIFKTNFKGIGNYRQYPVGEAYIHCCPSVFWHQYTVHSTHHTSTTTTVSYVIPSPHTCISTLLLWQFCTAFTYGISSCKCIGPNCIGRRLFPGRSFLGLSVSGPK